MTQTVVSFGATVKPSLPKMIDEIAERIRIRAKVLGESRGIEGLGFNRRLANQLGRFLDAPDGFVEFREVNSARKSTRSASKIEWSIGPSKRLANLLAALRAADDKIVRVVGRHKPASRVVRGRQTSTA